MGRLIQVKDVPEEVHAALKSRAALAGMSLSEYLRALLSRTAARPSAEELAARVAARGSPELSEPAEVTVRRLRERGE
jgi:plasmid stability protein